MHVVVPNLNSPFRVQKRLFCCRLVVISLMTVIVTLVPASNGRANNVLSVISPSGKYVAFPCRGESTTNESGSNVSSNDVAIWDLHTALEVQRLVQASGIGEYLQIGTIRSIVFSPDEKYVLTAGTGGVIVWSLQTGERLHKMKETKDRVGFAAISPKGDLACATIKTGDVWKFRFASFPDLAPQTERAGSGINSSYPIAFSREGSRLFAARNLSSQEMAALNISGNNNGGTDSVLCEWDAKTGAILGEFRYRNGKGNGRGRISVNREFLAQADASWINVWDLATRRLVRQFYDQRFNGPAYFCDNRDTLLACGEADSTVEYDLRTGRVVHQQPLPKGWSSYQDGISLHPTGQFFCTADAQQGKLVICRLGDEADKEDPRPREPNYTAVFQSFESPRESMALLADGRTCRYSPALESNDPALSRAAARELGKKHDIEAVTTTMQELLRPRKPRPHTTRDHSKPRIFILAVGVSKHKYKEYNNLKYSADDARSIAERFHTEMGRTFGDVQSKVITDEEVSADSIRQGMNWLVNCSTESDYVVVVFSGHAITREKGLYYLPYAGDMRKVGSTCFNWSEVGKLLAATKGKQIFFVTDCCHAGAFAKEHFATQTDIARTVASAKQLTILTSSEGHEESKELSELKHGVFTYAFLEALDGSSDSNQDGNITWKELTNYVGIRVSELSSEAQHPRVQQTSTTADGMVIARTPKGTPHTDNRPASEPKAAVVRP